MYQWSSLTWIHLETNDLLVRDLLVRWLIIWRFVARFYCFCNFNLGLCVCYGLCWVLTQVGDCVLAKLWNPCKIADFYKILKDSTNFLILVNFDPVCIKSRITLAFRLLVMYKYSGDLKLSHLWPYTIYNKYLALFWFCVESIDFDCDFRFFYPISILQK
jgi:hypothetical protein